MNYNIYKRKDGRWEGRLLKAVSQNRKRSYYYFFGKSKADTVKKIDKFISSQSKVSCKRTFKDICDEWFDLVCRNIKESTAENYKLKLRLHLLPFFGSRIIDGIASHDVNDFIKLKQSKGLSGRYIGDILVLIKSIFKYAVRNYGIKSPMDGVIMPKKRPSDVLILNNSELNRLNVYLDKNINRTSLGIKLCLSTGLRIGELCALRGSDIDLEKRILTVSKTIQRIHCEGQKHTKIVITEPKSASSKRRIPIPKNLLPLLEKFLLNADDYILSGTQKPIEPRTMQYRFAKLLKNVKLPSIHFHALRHIFASNCIKLGFDVKSLSEILGHSSVEITLNRYVHSSFERKQELMDKISA